MDNNILNLALYLHILTCITLLFYFWHKIFTEKERTKIRNIKFEYEIPSFISEKNILSPDQIEKIKKDLSDGLKRGQK